MDVSRLIATSRNLMSIDIENRIVPKPQARKSRFLVRLAQGHAGHIAIPIAVPARLEPLVQLGVVREQGMGSFGIEDPGRAGDVAALLGALEAIFERTNELENAESHSGFVGIKWRMAFKCRNQRLTRRKLSISNHAFSPGSRSIMKTIAVAA